MKIKKGDKVIIISGKEKGKEGIVSVAMPKVNKVIIEGINLVKKHQKPTQDSPGAIINKEHAIHVSNVALLEPDSNSKTKIGFRFENNKKVRFSKKTQKVI